MRGNPEYITVNDGLPDNDIVRTKADFVIDEADWRASVRQGQVDSLLELIGKLAPVAPQLATVTLDLIVEAMDIPQRDELVKRIRQFTGQRDPDATEDSPEDVAKAQAAAAQQELAMRDANATIAKKEADAQQSLAKAGEIKARTTMSNVGAQKSALDAAGTAAAVPTLADIADHILHEAGFISRTEGEETMQALAEQAAQAQQSSQAAPPPGPAPQQTAIGLG